MPQIRKKIDSMVPSENDHGLIGIFRKIQYYLIFGLTQFGYYVHFFQENRSENLQYKIKDKRVS